MKADLSNPNHVKVLAALRMPQYVWRTINGVARDSGLDEITVGKTLMSLDHDIVIHHSLTPEGCAAFAARDHLIKSQTAWERLVAAFSNRVY